MPPPPLVFHRNDPSPERPLLEADVIPPLVPRDRQLARPIPIQGSAPAPLTGPQSYSLGSQESTMSDISTSFRPSPPPLTSTSTSGIPTPYTLRTPAPTTASVSTVRPIIAGPFSPSSPEQSLSPSDHHANGLVRVKSFPHNGDLLGNTVEAGGSRSTSRRATPPVSPPEAHGMDIDEDQSVQDAGSSPSSPDAGDATLRQTATRNAPARGSLTRLLQDIGNRPSAQTVTRPELTPSASRRPWDHNEEPRDPRDRPSSTFGHTSPGVTSPIRSTLHPQPPQVDSFRPFDQPALPYSSSSFDRYSLLGQQPDPWASPSSNTGVASAVAPSWNAPTSTTDPSRIAPSRFFSSSSSGSASPSDFRALPSPVSDLNASGSPGALERRVEGVETRLGRIRNRRSPPTPPPLFVGHSYEGLRNRSSSRPYEVPSRTRPSAQATLDGNGNGNDGTLAHSHLRPTRSAASHPAVRSPWLDAASAPMPTVPPPRPLPATMFSWVSEEQTDGQRREFDSSYRTSVPAAPRSAEERRASPLTTSRAPERDTPSPSTDASVTARPWYLQQRMNALDNLRTGPLRPTATHSALAGHHRPVPSAYRSTETVSPESSSFRHAFGAGFTDRSVRAPGGPFGSGWEWEPPAGSDEAPSRPSNRRWMSFDEGERERETSRDRDRDREGGRGGNEDAPLSALRRDVNQVVGRRMSHVRPRSSSVTRRQRALAEGWDDDENNGDSTGTASSRTVYTGTTEGEDRPTQRQRTENPERSLWGEVPGGSSSGSYPQPDNWNFGSRAPLRAPRDLTDVFLAVRERDRSGTTSPADELAAFLERNHRLRPVLASGGAGAGFGFGGGDLDAESVFLEHLRSRDTPMSRDFPTDLHDAYIDIVDGPLGFAYLNSLRRMQPSAQPVKLNPDMSDQEKSKVVQMVIRGVARLPSGPRKRAAEGVLEIVPWGQFGEREDMPRDEYCSVCHDEYEDETKVAVTPCKHMYHQDCLDTWLKTPNTSSCPMCRRDLAALACLVKMVPNTNVEEAMPYWINAVV